MGTVDLDLARRLKAELPLDRAVETGTFMGGTTRALAGVFPAVVTIERSEEIHAQAAAGLADLANVKALQGHSVDRLADIANAELGTLYFLDGHWSSDNTAGEDDECPVLNELATIGAGNPLDCFLIDDARLFTAPPSPPHNPAAWPTLLEVIDAIRANHPSAHITILGDQIIGVPPAAKPIVDAYGMGLRPEPEAPGPLGRLLGRRG